MSADNDYVPIDLSSLCNSENAVMAKKDDVLPTGKQSFHGLPFLIGPESGSGPFIIMFGKDNQKDPLSIALNRKATYLIFAHRQVDSEILKGDPAGRKIADYQFTYSDGQTISVPIRERMEIGVSKPMWGQWALLAHPNNKSSLFPRRGGDWVSAGKHQTMGTHGSAKLFYLWEWTNPHPEKEIKNIIVTPIGPRFYIAAITASSLEEQPITRGAKREVKIVLPNEEDAEKPFDLDVEVDRGVASYPFPLPKKTAEEFLEDQGRAGYGEDFNTKSSPAYVEVAASPSATVTVKQNNEEIGSVKWGELEEKKKLKPNEKLEMILVDEGRNWVKTKVLDDDTGHPIPCRIYFRSKNGIPFQPHGHHSQVNLNVGSWHQDVGGDLRLGQTSYAYINGKCEGWLPRGDVIVDIARGFEYEPIRTKVEVKPGQQELTFRIKRVHDLKKERYFSGDTHVHFLSTQGAHTEAAGEDLNVVNLLLSQWGNLFTNTEEFTGGANVSPDGQTIVYASQENRQHILGHLTLLGLKEPVYPWCSGGVSEAELGGNLETTLSRWADECHDQGGTVIIPHLPNPNGEPATLIATGRADAVEMLKQDEYNHLEYYRYLNCGYKLPLVGGTDKMTSDVPVGLYRTYVHIPDDQPFNYDTWCKALKNGNTFHSGGPLLRFSCEGKQIGSTIDLPGNGGEVEVTAEAFSVMPFHTVEIVVNGEVVARKEEASGVKLMTVKERLKIEKHSWVAARCSGPKYFDSVKHHDGWKRGIMAHTSPIYLAVGEPWWMFDAGTANYMLTLINGCIDYIHKRSPQWDEKSVTHHHHHHDHMEFLSEPFRQAIDSIHKRMHQLGIPH